MPIAKEAPKPAPSWRTWATILIILHLFCLTIGVASNAGGQASLVGRTLRNVPLAPEYLQLLFMDVAYDFELAGVAPRNGVHELILLKPNESDEVAARLPTDAMQPRIRRQRYQNLAYHVAEFDRAFADNPDIRTKLPLTLAEAWIADLGVDDQAPYTLRCQRTDSPRLEEDAQDQDEVQASTQEAATPEADDDKTIDIRLVRNPWAGHYQGARAQAPSLTAKSLPLNEDAGQPATD